MTRSVRAVDRIKRADAADFMLAQLRNSIWLRRKPVIQY